MRDESDAPEVVWIDFNADWHVIAGGPGPARNRGEYTYVRDDLTGKPVDAWAKIERGGGRPEGHVLVSYEWTVPDFANGGDPQKYWGVTGAWWNPKTQKWMADHGKPVKNVTHWMPVPGVADTD